MRSLRGERVDGCFLHIALIVQHLIQQCRAHPLGKDSNSKYHSGMQFPKGTYAPCLLRHLEQGQLSMLAWSVIAIDQARSGYIEEARVIQRRLAGKGKDT
jgi:hypothetical protein